MERSLENQAYKRDNINTTIQSIFLMINKYKKRLEKEFDQDIQDKLDKERAELKELKKQYPEYFI